MSTLRTSAIRDSAWRAALPNVAMSAFFGKYRAIVEGRYRQGASVRLMYNRIHYYLQTRVFVNA